MPKIPDKLKPVLGGLVGLGIGLGWSWCRSCFGGQ